jgi:hypothetical protein
MNKINISEFINTKTLLTKKELYLRDLIFLKDLFNIFLLMLKYQKSLSIY